jgi:AcrR family transcriptional regulator
MRVSYEDGGRVNQKRRTRTAVLQAAADLVRAGKNPTVAEAAEAAAVSRATAYRYFPTQESLLLEVVTTSRPAGDDYLGPLAGSEDAEARVHAVVDAMTDLMVEHDAGLRTMLKLSLERGLEDRDSPIREGRRARALEQALEPLRTKFSDEQLRSINAAVGMVIGTEALIVLRDIYGLEALEARALMRWAASILFTAATEAEGQLSVDRQATNQRRTASSSTHVE